jgi:ABC-type Fe3+-siderophore transport system permease subunit
MELKDIYDHTRDSLHYYVKWRERFVAGYFASLVALAFLFRWVLEKGYRHLLWVPFFTAAAASIFFWLLDRRNREQYRACFAVGAAVERAFVKEKKLEEASIEHIGLYHNLGAKSKKLSHSTALDAMYVSLAVVFAAAALYFLWRNK